MMKDTMQQHGVLPTDPLRSSSPTRKRGLMQTIAIGLYLGLLALAIASCGSEDKGDDDDDSCGPQCDGTTCGSDGCGSTCACLGAVNMCNSASKCCTPENGVTCCDRKVTEMCNRVKTCCDAAAPSACASWAYDVNTCKGQYVSGGYNCATMTDVSCCEEATSRCVGDIPAVACTDIIGGTAYFPAACDTDTF